MNLTILKYAKQFRLYKKLCQTTNVCTSVINLTGDQELNGLFFPHISVQDKKNNNNFQKDTSQLFDYFHFQVKNFADLTQIYVGQAKMKYKANNFVSGNITYATRRGFH